MVTVEGQPKAMENKAKAECEPNPLGPLGVSLVQIHPSRNQSFPPKGAMLLPTFTFRVYGYSFQEQ